MSGKLTKADYPPHWAAIRRAVLDRAMLTCECLGECGSNHCRFDDPHGRCSAPQHGLIVRDPTFPARWWPHNAVPWVAARHLPLKEVRVVFTIAHLCQDSTCDKMDDLKAMCQRCHLAYDAKQHARNAARTRRERRGGQLILWENPGATPDRRRP
jgi:hypothetical protein